MRLAAVLFVVLVLAVLAEVLPLVPVPTPRPPNYDQASSWLCRPRGGETGCIIAYSTYPADRPIDPDARFGRPTRPGAAFACVDPGAIANVASLDADLPLHGEQRARLGTDVTELPGLIGSRCTTGGPFSVLAIFVKPSTQAGETAAAMIDRLADYSPPWGLHGLDLDIAEGTLIDIVRRQAAAYAGGK